ncbi:ribose 5-phosphate isomerase B [Myxococcota bacterium]|nr:ribose 5-phosphate isomerase B [Myxococcota bacterium]MBU1534315.1 ribose 5-phosphate isomerase B [Myxococcota bacterium]
MQHVFIGSDHGGFALKQELIEELRGMGVSHTDVGVHREESADYPDIARDLARVLLPFEGALGILLCGTGIGISIAANKIAGVRAALCSDEYSAAMARRHNNANVLCLGGRVIGPELAKSILHTFLTNTFEGGRHQRRVDKLEHPSLP